MTPRAMARRYASALFDVVQQRGTVDAAAPELAAFQDLVHGHDELRTVLETPAVPAQKKRALVEALLAAGGRTDQDVKRLVLLLAERDRLALLTDISAAFAERLGQARRIVPAEVVTAVPLGDHRREALASSLRHATGSTVTITERVDPSIIGGVVARVGSVVFDGSVARQLARMKQELLSS